MSIPPASFRSFQALLNCEDKSLDEMANIICTDVGLSTAIISYANKAAHFEAVETVQESLFRLGGRHVFHIAASHMLTHSQPGPISPTQMENGLKAAFRMRQRAPEVRLDPNLAFSLGMFAFIGHWYLSSILKESHVTTYPQDPINALDWEYKYLNYTNADVGAYLLLRWQFPQSIAFSMQYITYPQWCPEAFRPFAHLLREVLQEITLPRCPVEFSPAETQQIQSILSSLAA